MADPIEVIQTVITVSNQIYGAVKCIKDAPEERKTLETEVSRLHVILEYLMQVLGRRTQERPGREAEALQTLCDQARRFIELASSSIGKGKERGYKLRKTEWPKWLLQRSNRQELIQQLQKLHASIDTYLLFDGHREMSELRAELGGGLRMTHEYAITQSDIMRTVQRRVEDLQSNVSAMQHYMMRRHYQQAESDQHINMLVQYLMRSAAESQANEKNQYYDQVTMGSKYSQDLADTTTSVATSSVHISNRPELCRPESFAAGVWNPGSPKILTDDICPLHCPCRCHGPSLSLIPHLFRSAIGNMLVDHGWISALLSARISCNDRACKRHRSNLLQIKYYCPTWFAQIDAQIRFERIPVHFVIQTPRVVQRMYWLEEATLDEIKQKLWSRELTVNDVNSTGYSMLHKITTRVTVDRSDTALSIVALITAHSARTEWEYNKLTPTENALWWSLVYWRLRGSRKAMISDLKHRLEPYLRQPIEDAWEELPNKLRWTDLHRRLCTLSPETTYPEQLGFASPKLASQVNVRDAHGRTPLFYAALDSPEAINALLHSGANPLMDNNILVYAARAGADAVFSLLIRAGAAVNSADANGVTVLHWVANYNLQYSINGFAVVVELIRHAGHMLKWDVRDKRGKTPLDWAEDRALRNPSDEDSKQILELYRTHKLPENSQYLPFARFSSLQSGDYECDKAKLPPSSLIRAGLHGDISTMDDLLQRGAMVNERDNDGHTLLHLIALGQVTNGYRVALELIRHGGWGVDWDARTAGGETALNIVRRRLEEGGLDEEEHKALTSLHKLLRNRRLPPGEDYLLPCMNPELYESPSSDAPMPGAWIEEWSDVERSWMHI